MKELLTGNSNPTNYELSQSGILKNLVKFIKNPFVNTEIYINSEDLNRMMVDSKINLSVLAERQTLFYDILGNIVQDSNLNSAAIINLSKLLFSQISYLENKESPMNNVIPLNEHASICKLI